MCATCFLFFFSFLVTRMRRRRWHIVDDDLVTLCVIFRVLIFTSISKKSSGFLLVFSRFLRFFFLAFFWLLMSRSHVSLERKRTGARIMEREGTTLGFYSWGIKYEQSVREVKPYLLFENQCRVRERNDDNRHSRSLFQSPIIFSFSSLFFPFFSLSCVFVLIRTPCIAFINHSWHACVYNGVLCTCEYNNYINESIAGRVSRGQQLD